MRDPTGLILPDLQSSIAESCLRLGIDRHTATAIYLSVREDLTRHYGGSDVRIPVRPTAEIKAEAIRLRDQGRSATEIARTLKVARATVYRWLS